MTNRQLQQRQRNHLIDANWVDSMVEVAKVCNNLFIKKCNVCTVYTDKQVEYEWRQQEKDNNSPVAVEQQQGHVDNGSLDINMYRQFLFDEDSVIAGASLRDDTPTEQDVDDDDEDDEEEEDDETRIKRMGSNDNERSVRTHGTN